MTTEAEERAEVERATWQYRGVKRTRGNQTMMGCLFLAVIGRNAANPPWVESAITILEDGACLVNFVNRERTEYTNLKFCHVTDLKDQFNRLADEINATDEERVAMFGELRKFIKEDRRLENDILRRI